MLSLAPEILFGMIAGFVGGYAGIAGAPLLVAAFVVLFGYTQVESQGTILAVMLGPMTLMGVIAMWDRARRLIGLVLLGTACYAATSLVGARLALGVGEIPLQISFAVLLVALGVWDLRYSGSTANNKKVALNPDGLTRLGGRLPSQWWAIAIVFLCVGMLGGLWGIGAGILVIPFLTKLMGIHKDDARTLSLAVLCPPVSLPAVLEYDASDAVRWDVAIAVFFAYFCTNFFGAKLGRRHSSAAFQRWFGALMLLLGLSYAALLATNFASR